MRALKHPRLRADSSVILGRSGGARTWESQAAAVKEFKALFRSEAAVSQKYRCAFCALEIGVDTGNRSDDIEHIAPRKIYAEWTFESLNLVLACEVCNRRRKKVFDSVEVKNATYSQCTFKLVHPYFDQISDHIVGGYVADLCAPSIPVARSDKGRATIKLFNLASADRLRLWKKDYLAAVEALNPDLFSRTIEKVMRELEK